MRSFVELRRGKKHERLPIRLHNGSGIGGLYTVSEARQLVEDLEDAIAVLENAGIVQVEVIGLSPSVTLRGRTFSYESSGSLNIGDLVEVPFGIDDAPHIAQVVAHGRGEYKGALKAVTARLERTQL